MFAASHIPTKKWLWRETLKEAGKVLEELMGIECILKTRALL